MRKIICLLTAISCSIAGFSQDTGGSFFIGLNLKGAQVQERVNLMTTGWMYSDAVNSSASRPEIDNEMAYGFDAQVGYFFGPKAKWGISTGFIYYRYKGTLTVNSMHTEYKSVDKWGDTYRQVVSTAAPIKETLETTSINIPLLLKYKTMFSKKVGLTVDAGFVYNVSMKTTYNARASFNYEAIYRFVNSGDGYVAVYDDRPQPRPDSWLITVDEYKKDKNDGKEAEYMQTLQAQGYNVGLNEEATSSGTITHKSGSLGLLLQPSLTFKLNDHISLNAGPYVMLQTVGSSSQTITTQFTDKIGEYNSVLNNNIRRNQTSYGINIGINLYL